MKEESKRILYKCMSLMISIVLFMGVAFGTVGCEDLEKALENLNDEIISSDSGTDDYSEIINNSKVEVKTLQEELAGDTYGLLYPKQREAFVGRQYYKIASEEDLIRAISDGLGKGIRGIVLQYDTHDYTYWENLLEKNKNRSEFGGYLNAGFVTDYSVKGELGVYPSFNEAWQAISYYRYKEPEISENTMKLLEAAHKLAEDAIKVSPDDEKGMLSYINEQICRMTKYSNPIPSGLNVPQRDATGVFFNGDAVCAGYATAFALVLNILGIENCTLNNDEKPDDANAHIWNYVKVNGSWYHIDATWNDNDYDDITNMHEYFMLTDDELAKKDTSTAHKWFQLIN
ncbi:MAG: hypothetical protein K6E47_05965 [Lachnospiraceae bacterium]|nr:hypothetical protein [Lachnospiraceae bacterium]